MMLQSGLMLVCVICLDCDSPYPHPNLGSKVAILEFGHKAWVAVVLQIIDVFVFVFVFVALVVDFEGRPKKTVMCDFPKLSLYSLVILFFLCVQKIYR